MKLANSSSFPPKRQQLFLMANFELQRLHNVDFELKRVRIIIEKEGFGSEIDNMVMVTKSPSESQMLTAK